MITPSVFAQAGVIFTIFHVYCYLGMALYGGVVTPGADFGVSASSSDAIASLNAVELGYDVPHRSQITKAL